ncbi:MFS transporter [Rhodococcus wratislaviensis]|uniref:MFS transporter n=1 Tax=Rhodococcus wratislaviensis TaxID=44752 RepID=UPI00351154C8
MGVHPDSNVVPLRIRRLLSAHWKGTMKNIETKVGTNTVAAQLDRMPIGRTHRMVVVAIGLGLFFELYEIFLSGTISVALQNEWGVEGTQLKLFLASTFVGMFFGAAFMGSLADRFGRKNAFVFNLVWFSVWSLLAAFSPNAWFLIIARFFAGVGIGAEYPVADAYLSDVLPKDKRGKLATIAYTCACIAIPLLGFLSMFLIERMPFGIDGWRWLLGLGAVGAIIVLVLRRNLPESPRWLAATGRHEEAERTLRIFAAGSGVEVAPVDRIGAVTVEEKGTAAQAWQLLRKRPYSGRFTMMSVFHLMQTFGYYGFGTMAAMVLVSRGFDVTSSLLFVALSYIGYPVGSAISVPLVSKFERRTMLVVSLLALAVSGLLFATATSAVGIVVFGFLVTMLGNVYSNIYHVYQAEIFPTQIRGTAVGTTYSLSRLTSAALPFILIPVLDGVGATAMFVVITAAILVAATAIRFMGPRTNNRSLEELNPV